MTRRRLAILGALALVVAIGVVLPFAVPEWGLEIWRTYTRLRFGATSGAIVVDGQRIEIAEIGEGPPVVLVHGLRGESTVLMPLAREIARHGRRAVLLDLPGHGRSPAPAEPLSFEHAGEIVLGTIDALDLGPRPPIVGHSIGAWVVAWQALAAPERVGPVVLVGTPGLAFEPPPYPQLIPDNADDAREALPLLFAEPRYVPRPILAVSAGRDPSSSIDLLRSAMSGRYLLDGLFEGLAVPALVVCGEDDRLVPPDVGRELAALSPRARYVGVPRTSHLIVWEAPAAVADAIDAFLDDVSSEAKSAATP